MSRPLERAGGLLLVCGAVALMLAPMQGAWFTVIDDHHVVGLAGDDGRISAGEAAARARGWAFERNGRVRPLFWVLWHFEAWWAGVDPAWWHADRMVLALVTAAALYLALEAVLPPLAAALAAFGFFCGFQNEIWMRLRVQETYASVLAAVGIAVLARRMARGRANPLGLLPGFAALALAGLVKESFAPLLPAALAFIYVVRPALAGGEDRTFWTRADRVVVIALASWAAAAALSCSGRASPTGPPIASRSRSFRSRPTPRGTCGSSARTPSGRCRSWPQRWRRRERRAAPGARRSCSCWRVSCSSWRPSG